MTKKTLEAPIAQSKDLARQPSRNKEVKPTPIETAKSDNTRILIQFFSIEPQNSGASAIFPSHRTTKPNQHIAAMIVQRIHDFLRPFIPTKSSGKA